MFKTGSGLLRQVDEVTADGYQKIFTTNLFGHFILVIIIIIMAKRAVF